jgi:hypothetical protein
MLNLRLKRLGNANHLTSRLLRPDEICSRGCPMLSQPGKFPQPVRPGGSSNRQSNAKQSKGMQSKATQRNAKLTCTTQHNSVQCKPKEIGNRIGTATQSTSVSVSAFVFPSASVSVTVSVTVSVSVPISVSQHRTGCHAYPDPGPYPDPNPDPYSDSYADPYPNAHPDPYPFGILMISRCFVGIR